MLHSIMHRETTTHRINNMKIEKVSVSVENGTMDCVGGVRTEFSPFKYTDEMEFKIKAVGPEANIQITLTGRELDNLVHVLRYKI